MIYENISTTIVRSAVATSESVFLIPHFANIAVRPANNADNAAIINHMFFLLPVSADETDITSHMIMALYDLSVHERPAKRRFQAPCEAFWARIPQ